MDHKPTLSRVLLLICMCALPGCLTANRPDSPARSMSIPALLSRTPPPNTRYYAIIYGSQSTPRVPAKTHSWGTMIKVTSIPGETPIIETHTISWLPDSLDIRWWRFRVEPGSNFSLEDSMEIALNTGQRISMWGPYEVWHGIYERFVVQKQFLDSDAVGYQCYDGVGEAGDKGNGCSCFHALSDMDPFAGRWRYPVYLFGEMASRNIVSVFHQRPTIINTDLTHDWLIPVLGLDRYPIIRRQYRGRSVEFSPEAAMELWHKKFDESRRWWNRR